MSSRKKQSSKFNVQSSRGRPRYVMIGGFLGAGKTTAVAALGEYFKQRGVQVGLITNDQGSDLVDTAMLTSRGFAVREIAGGCFCCRFSSLTEAAQNLSAETRPEVFIAEPVGSCTDIVATVSYPLRRIYGNDYVIAPVSVMLDPVRALRVFDIEDGPRFSEKVRYIYSKQLEEADIIVINKCDLVGADRLSRLHRRLRQEFPQAEVFEVSARTGFGLEPWFERLVHSEQQPRPTIQIDYDTYADGEALLGWLNTTIQLSSSAAFDANSWLEDFCDALQRGLVLVGAETAHLKMTLDPENGFGDLGVINLVRNDFVPELSQKLPDPILDGQLVINLRAEAAPEVLEHIVKKTLAETTEKEVIATIDHLESFRPGRPQPTCRMEAVEESSS